VPDPILDLDQRSATGEGGAQGLSGQPDDRIVACVGLRFKLAEAAG